MKAHGTAKGHSLKHSRAKKVKHHKTTKHHPVHHAKAAAAKKAHHVTAKAKHPAHAKAKGLALDTGDVACCTAEALAASLSCQGLYIPDAAILELFRSAGGDEDRGIPVPVLLEAAAELGLAGYRPVFRYIPDWHFGGIGRHAGFQDRLTVTADTQGPAAVCERPEAVVRAGEPRHRDIGSGDGGSLARMTGGLPDGRLDGGRVIAGGLHGLILGVDLPGQHAVLATPEGWWSWGELWCPCEFPDAVIDGAWAVEWAAAA